MYANPAFWEWVMVNGDSGNHSIVEFLEDPILADPNRIDHDGRHVILKWRHNDTRWEQQITYLIRIDRDNKSYVLFCFYPYELHHIPEFPNQPSSAEKKGSPENFSNLEALGQLSAGIAHDFNNILSVIEGFTHMIIRRQQDGQTADKLLDKLLAATRRGASLTQQLLAFGQQRILNGGKVTDLGPLISHQLELCQPLLPDWLTLDTDLPRHPVPISGDIDAIGQIITNLITNARDAVASNDGEINVTLHPPDTLPAIVNNDLPSGKMADDFTCIEIKDNGHGIPDEELRHIFNPFYTTKDAGLGNGLGLSIVYGMAQQLGGDVRVESKIGQFTSFYVILPVSDKPVNGPTPTNQTIQTVKLPAATIMLVEDGDDLRDILTEQLNDYGLRVLAARDGNHALSIEDAHDGPIHVLLSDIIMPGMDGLHLAEIFTELRPEATTIFISGQPQKGHEWNDRIPRDATILTKPVAPDYLFTQLQSRLERVYQK